MGALRFFWIVGLIYSTLLLTISFFVMVVLRKIDNRNLKLFGYAVTILLWLSAAFVFFSGIYLSTRGFVRPLPGLGMPGPRGNQIPGQLPPK